MSHCGDSTVVTLSLSLSFRVYSYLFSTFSFYSLGFSLFAAAYCPSAGFTTTHTFSVTPNGRTHIHSLFFFFPSKSFISSDKQAGGTWMITTKIVGPFSLYSEGWSISFIYNRIVFSFPVRLNVPYVEKKNTVNKPELRKEWRWFPDPVSAKLNKRTRELISVRSSYRNKLDIAGKSLKAKSSGHTCLQRSLKTMNTHALAPLLAIGAIWWPVQCTVLRL